MTKHTVHTRVSFVPCSAANWLKPPSKKKAESKWPRYLTKNYLRNNVRKVVFYSFFMAINIWLFIWRTYVYSSTHWSVAIARGCGMCLNFNSAFILVLMLRYTLTFIRSTPVGNFLPLDQSISIHKFVGWTIFIQSVIHTVAHLIYIGNKLTNCLRQTSPQNLPTFPCLSQIT